MKLSTLPVFSVITSLKPQTHDPQPKGQIQICMLNYTNEGGQM